MTYQAPVTNLPCQPPQCSLGVRDHRLWFDASDETATSFGHPGHCYGAGTLVVTPGRNISSWEHLIWGKETERKEEYFSEENYQVNM